MEHIFLFFLVGIVLNVNYTFAKFLTLLCRLQQLILIVMLLIFRYKKYKKNKDFESIQGIEGNADDEITKSLMFNDGMIASSEEEDRILEDQNHYEYNGS